jgi:hypothetical protein
MTVLPFPGPSDGARHSDPPTSWKAAAINQSRRNELRFNMLYTHGILLRDRPNWYVGQQGLTADEIARVMNLPVPANGGTSKMCHWKRHSELYRVFGYLDVTLIGNQELEREGQHVLIINQRGLRHIDDMLRRYPNMTERKFD